MIEIIDAVMGSGKSTFMIERLNDPKEHGNKYIIILPSLSEVTRYKEYLSDEHSGQRSDIVALDTEESENKTDRLVQAVKDGKTVITTHRLFTIMSAEDFRAIEDIKEYDLIIDETITLIGKKSIKDADIQALIADGYMETADHPEIDGLKHYQLLPKGVDYIDDGGESHRRAIKAVSGKHVYQVDKHNVVFVVPPDKLEAFRNVVMMTYLFKGSETNAWLDLFSLIYNHSTFVYDPISQKPNGTVHHPGSYHGSIFKPLLKVHDHNINRIGVKKPRVKGEPLSKSWFERQKSSGAGVKKLSMSTRTFFTSHTSTGKSDMMWTCYLDHRDWISTSHFDPKRKKVAGKYVNLTDKEQTFVSQTTRGTNDYINRHFLAFLVNVNPKPEMVKFFRNNKVNLDEDTFALSRLVQWTWRSAIRKEDPVVLYLPSERMRKLLQGWLNK